MVTQVTIDSIAMIGQEILTAKRKFNKIAYLVEVQRRDQKVNDNYIKIIFGNVSAEISTVVIDCVQNRVASLAFYGTLSVTPVQLSMKYGHCREAYSVHDDLYFYYFNSEKKLIEYSISFFEPNHQKINVERNNESLSNILLNW